MSLPAERKLKLLVAIASFGEKNLECLKGIIRAYQEMPFAVDVVVVSNAPKDLGPEVKVVVGLPITNPWSLPFAHKPIFTSKAGDYDLFIYSEDDMAVTERNIRAFLEVTPQLADDEIAGFLRYEISPTTGAWSLPEVHGYYRWKPETAARRGPYSVAEFTNEHAAFYLLTQAQLKRAIASGGFNRPPYEGRYDMLCTAATDPYTSCGFRKVVCLSRVEDFLIHHVPNRYANQLGLPLPEFKQQVEILIEISHGTRPASTLGGVESKMLHARWSKNYDEKPVAEILDRVPREAATVLSIGSGWGRTESKLKQRGAKVTVLPLDSVVGATAGRLDMEVIYGTLEECFKKLAGRHFDCVLMTDWLHLQPDAEDILAECCRFVGGAGVLVVNGPNFFSLPIWAKRIRNQAGLRKLSDFAAGGIQLQKVGRIKQIMEKAGLGGISAHWFDRVPPRKLAGLRGMLGRFAADSWVVSGRRPAGRAVNVASATPANASRA